MEGVGRFPAQVAGGCLDSLWQGDAGKLFKISSLVHAETMFAHKLDKDPVGKRLAVNQYAVAVEDDKFDGV